MDPIEQSEQTRKKMLEISRRVNQSLDHHAIQGRVVGIKYEHNPEYQCPRCGRKYIASDGHNCPKEE
jgi:hypothetical protein